MHVQSKQRIKKILQLPDQHVINTAVSDVKTLFSYL